MSKIIMYLRQALATIREEKLYSAMYVAGTALAIAFTMVIAEIYYVKVADIAPEVNRSKTYYLPYMGKNSDEGTVESITQEVFRELFQKMQTPERVTGVVNIWASAQPYMKLADGIHDCAVKVRMTEPGYFDFYRYRFIEGTPFTQNDFDSRQRVCVVTEEVSRKLEGSKSLILDNRPYRICGVVETPSALTELASADIIVPWTAEGLFARYHAMYSDMPVDVFFAVKASRRKAFMQELREVEARYNAMHPAEPVDIFAELKSHYALVWRDLNFLFDVYEGSIWWYVAAAILLLLLVPALNLSSMVASRMERRLPEMAVRKAFGAKRRTLLWQVIRENMTLTLIGGLLGLCLAWLAIYAWRDWVFYAFSEDATLASVVPVLKGEMLFGPAVFAIALLVCCVLNVLAATVPAWLSLRKPIVESLMIKK
ncbi:MAG: ABC transporter permease [Bacteroidaceae bacterium]|nr:ABC transporter permease [Bacteroidaceae bacterium]